jgi:hypothetical protein
MLIMNLTRAKLAEDQKQLQSLERRNAEMSSLMKQRTEDTPELPLNSSLYVVLSVRTFLCAPETEPVCHLGKFSETKNRIFSTKLTIRICFLHG